jgi:3-phosphoshikimate 1-carboxyvinyltransferase
MTKTAAATSSQDIVRIEPSHRLRGEYRPPADKSISHRALILAAMAAGRSTVSPVSGSADVASVV